MFSHFFRTVLILGLFSAFPLAAQNLSAIEYILSSESWVEYSAETELCFFVNDTIKGKNTYVEGYIKHNRTNISKSYAEIKVNADTFYTDNSLRDKHIRKLLNASEYPFIVFKLCSLEPIHPYLTMQKGEVFQANGILTVNGISKFVMFPVTFFYYHDHLEIDGELRIMYNDFAIEPPVVGRIIKQAKEYLTLKAHIVAIMVDTFSKSALLLKKPLK